MSTETVVAARIGEALGRHGKRPLVVGLCGAQGSGKTTLALALRDRFPSSVMLSLDDFYLTRVEREAMAAERHPLFATRGVPGTHDVDLAIATLDRLCAGERTRLPQFSKAADDRLPLETWPEIAGSPDFILFEGWCVGAVPQAEAALIEPINRLERDQDRDGSWRHAANQALAGLYQTLFARLDLLILLAAPDWPTVGRWREQQEEALRYAVGLTDRVMDAAAVGYFVQHYERLSRHILAEMPARADLIIRLSPDRHCQAVERNDSAVQAAMDRPTI